jgi:hypothetical protein
MTRIRRARPGGNVYLENLLPVRVAILVVGQIEIAIA